MSYSIQLYTVRKALEEDLPGTIQRLAEIGFTQVEPYNFVATAAELGAGPEENGLTAPSGHAPAAQPGPGRNLRRRQGAGHQHRDRSRTCRPSTGSPPRTSRPPPPSSTPRPRRAPSYGIRVGYHNHGWELESTHRRPDRAGVLRGPPRPGTRPGSGHLLGRRRRPGPGRSCSQRLGDRVKFIHIKDGPVTTDTKASSPWARARSPVWDVIDAAESLEVGVVEFDDYSRATSSTASPTASTTCSAGTGRAA